MLITFRKYLAFFMRRVKPLLMVETTVLVLLGCSHLYDEKEELKLAADLSVSRQTRQESGPVRYQTGDDEIVIQKGAEVDWRSFFKPAATKKQSLNLPDAKIETLPSDDIIIYIEGVRQAGGKEKAESLALRILEKNDDNLDLVLATAGIMIENNHYKEALSLLAKAKEKLAPVLYGTPETIFHYRYLLALSYIGLNENASGLKILSDLISLQKNFSPAYFALASFYLNRNKVEVSEYIVKRGLDNDPTDPPLNALLAKIFFDQGQISQALAKVEEALKKDPLNLAALLTRSQIFVSKRQFETAEMSLRKALTIAPKNPEIFVILGVCQNQSGQFEAAEQSFERAIILDPENAVARYNLAVLLSGKISEKGRAFRLFSEVAALEQSSETLKTAALSHIKK